jgi:putative glycosyltransferase
MRLSVVTSLYKSELHLFEFYTRICTVALKLFENDFEIILVNDGSPDRSLEIAKKIVDNDKRVRVVNLSRNFGHHKALMAGLSKAQGENIFLIDVDLEEKPEWLLEFHSIMKQNNSDVVFGFQEKRRGTKFDKWIGSTFYKMVQLLTDIKVPSNFVTARLMSRRYVLALLLHKEYEINLGGLWYITGFKQTPHPIVKLNVSSTTYNLKRKISHTINTITSFSNKPLYLIFVLGIIVFISSLIFTGFLASLYLINSKTPSGYLSIIVSIWIFSGLTVVLNGIQAIYIGKIFSEVKQRPNSIIQEIYGGENDQ